MKKSFTQKKLLKEAIDKLKLRSQEIIKMKYMTEHYEDLLALALLSNSNYADAYQLCKILAWKFKIINCREIINRIETKGYVNTTYQESEQLKFFTLTEVGKNLLEEKRLALGKVLKDNFHEESNFITSLVS